MRSRCPCCGRAPHRAPDLAYHKTLREPLDGLQTYPPDLSIEIRSATETDDGVKDKLNDLFSLGASVVWVISLENRNVKVYRSWTPSVPLAEQACETYLPGDTLDVSPTIPGLTISIADLFDL